MHRVLGAVAAVLALSSSVSVQAEVAREALVPAGLKVLARVQAQGVQIYECEPADGGMAWRFREPLATLMQGGKTVGRHFAGPGWEMTDGSGVRGRVVEQAAGESARDVPWLRLHVVGHTGGGSLARATEVARVSTRGGLFGGECAAAGSFHLEPYSATYLFLGE